MGQKCYTLWLCEPTKKKLFVVTFKRIKLESHSWSQIKAHFSYIMKPTNFLKIRSDKAGLCGFISVFSFVGIGQGGYF